MYYSFILIHFSLSVFYHILITPQEVEHCCEKPGFWSGSMVSQALDVDYWVQKQWLQKMWTGKMEDILIHQASSPHELVLYIYHMIPVLEHSCKFSINYNTKWIVLFLILGFCRDFHERERECVCVSSYQPLLKILTGNFYVLRFCFKLISWNVF